MRRTKNEQMFAEAVETITQAEDLMRVHNKVREGMHLLTTVRESLGRLVGK
jgi:hypothetical protein